MQTYIRVVSSVSRAFGIFSMLLLAAAVLVVSQMIFVRYVLNGSTIWQTEFVIYSIIAATLLGSPAVLIDRGHVGVDLLPEAMHGRGRLVLQIIAGVASLVFCAVLAWSGWIYFHEALTRGWKTATVWALPLWIPLLPMPVGIGLLCLQYVAELMKLTNPGLGERPA
ncbi:TRAP transporter small permease subunit [Microbaculum sp. FT89]|uniref:TRAP transporter small permease subunit n=1 Tax=Microbaculum sp. FT89 TaxID=3447298 RepID=UPI003F5395A3